MEAKSYQLVDQFFRGHVTVHLRCQTRELLRRAFRLDQDGFDLETAHHQPTHQVLPFDNKPTPAAPVSTLVKIPINGNAWVFQGVNRYDPHLSTSP